MNQTLYTACVTPFNDTLEIDFTSLKEILKLQSDASNGIVLLGSTGESLSLSWDEKISIINFALGLALRSEIIINIPNDSLHNALKMVEFCNSIPIAGIMVSSPIYSKPGFNGHVEWFKAIFEKSNHPVLIYNIPSRSGVKIDKSIVSALYKHKNFAGIKDSGGDINQLNEYLNIDKNIKVFCGDDIMISSYAIFGVCGLISVVSNIWPTIMKKHVYSCMKSQGFNVAKDNRGDMHLWWNILNSMQCATNPIPIKYLLYSAKIILTPNLRPPLNIADLPENHKILEYYNIISNRIVF